MAKTLSINTGDIINELEVVSPAAPHVYPNGTKRRQFNMKCHCGNMFVANINNLRSGNTTSCGCGRKTHGMHDTRQYQCWADMKTRCDNVEHACYKDYGGRGISYDLKWKTFEGFWEDMHHGYSDELTINRVGNDGNYCKDNCIWDTQTNQNHMRRKREGTFLSTIGSVFDHRDCKMYARIAYDGSRIHLGWYETEAEVAEAYDMASEVLYNDRPNKTNSTRDAVASKVSMFLKRHNIDSEERLAA